MPKLPPDVQEQVTALRVQIRAAQAKAKRAQEAVWAARKRQREAENAEHATRLSLDALLIKHGIDPRPRGRV